MAIDPTLLNPTESAAVPFDQFTATFDDAIRNATSQLSSAQSRYLDAKSRLDAIPPGVLHDDDRKAAQDELAKAGTVVEQAATALTSAHERKGAAIERYSQRSNVPQELKDRYAAMAKLENLNATQKQAEVAEFLNTAPERREQVSLATQKARADVAVAQAQADVAGATTDIQKQEAQTRLDAANQSVKNAQAQEAATRAATRVTSAQATTAEATARVAPEQAQATLTQAQATASKAQIDYLDAKRRYDSTTDEQVKASIAIELQQKQTALDTANQQLEQAKKLMPIAVGQAQATLESTQAGTQKGLLGTLYGLQERTKAIADMYRNGQLTDPAQGQAMLQDYINTTIQGTTPFARDSFLAGEETARRGQESTLAATKAGVLGSAFSSGLSAFGKLNDTVQPGSDAAGLGFIASQRQMMANLAQYAPTTPVNSPLLQSMRTSAPPAVAPPAQGNGIEGGVPLGGGDGSGHTITINIGGSGAASTPQPPTTTPLAPGQTGTNADPNVAGSPAFLTNNRPATPADVAAIWADHPDLQRQMEPAMSGGG